MANKPILRISAANRTATLSGVDLRLSRYQYNLLAFLAGAPNIYFTRAEILDSIYGTKSQPQTNALSVFVWRINLKIKQTLGRGIRPILSNRAGQYRFNTAEVGIKYTQPTTRKIQTPAGSACLECPHCHRPIIISAEKPPRTRSPKGA